MYTHSRRTHKHTTNRPYDKPNRYEDRLTINDQWRNWVKMQHPTVKDKLAGESKFFIALGKISPFGYFLQPIFLLVVEETKRLNRFSVFFSTEHFVPNDELLTSFEYTLRISTLLYFLDKSKEWTCFCYRYAPIPSIMTSRHIPCCSQCYSVRHACRANDKFSCASVQSQQVL